MVTKKKPVRELPKGYMPAGGIPLYVAGTSPAWNREKVAAQFGLSDVWKDLIEFNFPTVAYETSFQDKCAAVNWYLEERVGCTKSHDGTNYSFEGAGIGIIYVPSVVSDDVGRRAAKSVLDVLGSPYVHHIDFVLGSMFIHPTFFHKVGHAVLDGKIGLAVNPRGLSPSAEAEYDQTVSPPMLNLRYSRINTPYRKSAVIHEAVHAISHMKGKDRSILFDEGNAYLAQAIYYRKATGTRLTYLDPKKDGICQVADELAQKVLRYQLLGQEDNQALQDKVVKVYPTGTYYYSAYPFPK